MNARNEQMKKLIGLQSVDNKIDYDVLENIECDGYKRELIQYYVRNRKIIAFLLTPNKKGNLPAVLINHQHNSERNLGKSEVCGLAGNPLQAFGTELVKRGFIVLAPDSLCFEDRRTNASGITQEKNPNDDFSQHYNELCYGILNGETLAQRVIEDGMGAISVLNAIPFVDKNRIGCLGHSYGGNTTIYLAAFDKRIKYACASGSAVTFKNRIANNVGIEMASVIPNFLKTYDIDDVVCEISPTKFLIVCADNDKYSKDAMDTYSKAKVEYRNKNAAENLFVKQYEGGHAITEERFHYVIDWMIKYSNDRF